MRGAPLYALSASIGPAEALATVVLSRLAPHVFHPGLRREVVDPYFGLEMMFRAIPLGALVVMIAAAVVSRGALVPTLLRAVVPLALMLASLVASQVLLGLARPFI